MTFSTKALYSRSVLRYHLEKPFLYNRLLRNASLPTRGLHGSSL